MKKVSIKRSKKDVGLVTVNMTIREGDILILLNALENYSTPVARDISRMFRQAMKDNPDFSMLELFSQNK